MITLRFLNQTRVTVKSGLTIEQLAQQIGLGQTIVGGILNGKVHDLQYKLKKNGSFQWIEKNSAIGALMLERSLCFIFIVAVKECFSEAKITVEHTLSSGLYISIDKQTPLTSLEIDQIRTKMQSMIDQRVPIIRKVVSKQEAVDHFTQLGMLDKALLLKQRSSEKSSIYSCLGQDDYFYGVMTTHAGMIDQFTLLPYHLGVWLSQKKEFVDQPKLFEVFRRFEQRGKKTGISQVYQLNNQISQGKLPEIIQENEQRVQQDLQALCQDILKKPHVQIILIAGPSSAGKTTFSRRLAELLIEHNCTVMPISMDDFFKNRVDSPRLPDGSYDYENIECLDLDLFNQTIQKLLNHESVVIPHYNFKEGIKEFDHEPVQLYSNEMLIIEGIHALNPRSSAQLSDSSKFRIYINALTHLNYDNHNRIPTSDYRLIRRMTRDYQFRGRSLSETIETWPKVKEGEDRYIYPYQEEADVLFNTSMDYELPILKTVLMPLLDEIAMNDSQYIEANRIRKLLAYFLGGNPDLVPNTSILKEFLGGSVYTG